MEIDTGAPDNFISEYTWKQLGRPKLFPNNVCYESATRNALQLNRTCYLDTSVSDLRHSLPFNVTKSPLNLIGLRSIGKLGISLDSIYRDLTADLHSVRTSTDMQFNQLQQKCQNICKEFPNLFKEELGCLKDVKLDIIQRSYSRPSFSEN